jgi:glycosyltransferase involved in cell wall biosynthesis
VIRGGNRVHNLKTRFNDKKPIITVITVARNCEDTIEDTIVNVINQKFRNIEYIIIDGASSDNTLEIIKKYERSIDYWISELDNGIYDAMNKGIDLATGDWINFMNAGDSFYNYNLFSTIFDQFEYNKFDVIYGDFIAKDDITNQRSVFMQSRLRKYFQEWSFHINQ